MLLKNYNFKELCGYYNIKCSLPEQAIDEGIARIYRLRQEFLKLLKETPDGSLKGFLRFQFDMLLSLIKAAKRVSVNKDIDVPEDLRHAMETLKRSKGHIPINLMRIPLELLHYQLFRQIPCSEPSLDIGTGDGFVSNYVFAGHKITVGSDPSILSMIYAKKEGNVHQHYIGIDGNAIPFSDGVFNTVVAVHSIDHVRDRKQVLSEMSRVLRPGGRLALSDLSEHAVSFLPMTDIFKAIGFPKLGQDFIKYYFNNGGAEEEPKSPDWYYSTLVELGFEDVKINYFMSEQLARLSFLFFHFELLAAEPSFSLAYINDRYLRKQIYSFAEEVFLPLVAEDADICSKEKKGFNLFVSARKKAGIKGKEYAEENTFKMMRCPSCKGLLSFEKEYVNCTMCNERFPIIENICFVTPSAAEAYKLFFRQVGSKYYYLKIGMIRKKIGDYLCLKNSIFSFILYKMILFIERFPAIRRKISKFYGG